MLLQQTKESAKGLCTYAWQSVIRNVRRNALFVLLQDYIGVFVALPMSSRSSGVAHDLATEFAATLATELLVFETSTEQSRHRPVSVAPWQRLGLRAFERALAHGSPSSEDQGRQRDPAV